MGGPVPTQYPGGAPYQSRGQQQTLQMAGYDPGAAAQRGGQLQRPRSNPVLFDGHAAGSTPPPLVSPFWERQWQVVGMPLDAAFGDAAFGVPAASLRGFGPTEVGFGPQGGEPGRSQTRTTFQVHNAMRLPQSMQRSRHPGGTISPQASKELQAIAALQLLEMGASRRLRLAPVYALTAATTRPLSRRLRF